MDSDIDVASLMMKHFEVEFVFDKQGRIRSANYWTDARAAKFVLGITRTKRYGPLVLNCLKKSVVSWKESQDWKTLIPPLVLIILNNTFLSCLISIQAQNENFTTA